MDTLAAHRLQFAFTITYHYLFPQLTMGLAFLVFLLKTRAYFRADEAANHAARFAIRIFGLSFVMGVVTGIPMEFQFGTNWARFSSMSGGIIGQTLAMEGMFAFFLESSFLYLLLYAEGKIGPRLHWISSLLLWLGTWASGYFIVCTNAWMQHPVGYEIAADGSFQLTSIWALLLNPWVFPEYLHTMNGAVITGSFTMAALGAFYTLRGRRTEPVSRMLSLGVIVGVLAALSAAFPTGDLQAKLVAEHQPVGFAAMEGHFHSEDGAGLTLIGQPNMEQRRLDNQLVLPNVLSLLTYQRWNARIRGLEEFPEHDWPDNVPLLYYCYHVMAGLGTMFIALALASAVQLRRKRLSETKTLLWAHMLIVPLPFVANTAGWMTAELGRQPWIIHGLLRTSEGHSLHVSGGNVLFTLLGFMGLYALLSLLFVLLLTRIVAQGPTDPNDPSASLADTGSHSAHAPI
ncbi:MAG TPA: cytochrome ubiquinol oxidase subunit I [Polyangiaceae bacterium]|nr:cytochrome ubiquinol oxidase subunit I [Polyangiaceae bacterium]